MALAARWQGQASSYDLVTDTRIAPKMAWSYLNPARGSSLSLAVTVGAAVGGGRPMQGDRHVRGRIEPVGGHRQVRLLQP